MDGAGDLYAADTYNHAIHRIVASGTNWVVSTIAGSPGQTGSDDGTNRLLRCRRIGLGVLNGLLCRILSSVSAVNCPQRDRRLRETSGSTLDFKMGSSR